MTKEEIKRKYIHFNEVEIYILVNIRDAKGKLFAEPFSIFLN
jgi:hypothetical protein